MAALRAPEVRDRLAADGLSLVIPPFVVRVRSTLPFFADQLHALYRDFRLAPTAGYADVDARLVRVPGWRARLRPEVQFVVDGVTPFEPFPLAHALPMFEWGVNWVFSHRMHERLLLHAAVVERGGRAVLLPAWPGSGKSTLAVSLMMRGWRFLSDEFGVATLGEARVHPFVRPAALKNASIDVMRAFAPDGYIGPVFRGTRKGDVAHVRPSADSVARAHESAAIAAIVFPDFQAGAPATLQALEPATAFLKLAGNSFNYEIVGERAFRTVAAIVRRAPCRMLRYGDLDAAHAALDALLQDAATP